MAKINQKLYFKYFFDVVNFNQTLVILISSSKNTAMKRRLGIFRIVSRLNETKTVLAQIYARIFKLGKNWVMLPLVFDVNSKTKETITLISEE